MKIPVLDHGFVALLNISGPTRRPDAPFDADDVDPANVARISFDNFGSERTREQEMKLVRYLMANKHTSPIEMIEVWLEMKMPIFVARQFVRHRTAAINEVSGRYVTLPGEWYIPETIGGKPINAKQGQSDTLDLMDQAWFKHVLHDACSSSYRDYLEAIERGVAAEHARMLLHLNHYTHWVWKQDLHNLMHFLRLRDHSHAQVEAQEYAKAIILLLREAVPGIMQIFDELR